MRKRIPLGTHEKAVASSKAARIVKAAAQGTLDIRAALGDAKRKETYAEAADRIRATRRVSGLNILGELPVDTIRPMHIRQAPEYARDTGKSQKILANIRAAACVVFDELWRNEVIAENPVKRAPFVRSHNDNRERAVLTDAELSVYLDGSRPRAV